MTSTQRTLALKTLLQLVAGSAIQNAKQPPRKGPESARAFINDMRRPKLVQRSA